MQYKEIPIFVPNEIFYDFANLKYKSNKHYSFMICYYILVSYFYYYSFYGDKLITKAEIKTLLSLSKTNTRLDYITKRNGLLDSTGYTYETNNIPIKTVYNDNIPNWIYYNMNTYSYKIKCPRKAFYRHSNDVEYTGTFYDVVNTTKVDMNIFYEIINNLGINAFVIYLYIKKHNTLMMGYTKLANNLLMSRRIVVDKTNLLELYGYINIKHADYDFRGNFEYSNIYTVNPTTQL
jgi:hypothetical protein